MKDLIIYSYGSGEALASVFNAIAQVLRADEEGVLNAFIRTGALSGLTVVLITTFQTQSLQDFIKQWFLPTFLTVGGLFIPTTTVNIVDKVIRHYHIQVDHVPLGLALVASFTSHLSHHMTVLLEKNFSSLMDLSYHKTGSMFASQLMIEAQSLRLSHDTVSSNMREFVGQCVIPEAMMGKKYTPHDLKTSDDLWGLIKENASQVRLVSYQEPPQKAQIMSCKAAAQKLESLLKQEVDHSFSFLQRKFFGSTNDMMNKEIKSLLPSAVSVLTKVSQSSAEHLMRQMIMVPTLVEEADKISVSYGNAPKFAARRAYLQQRTTWQTYGEMAKTLYPMLKAVIEALLYTLFIFLIPLSLIQLGFKAVGQWIRLVTWINLWSPLYAIINSMSTYMAARDISLVAKKGLTIASSAGIMDANADWVATCGYISLMGVPTLAWALVSGTQLAVTHLAGALTGSTQSLAGMASGEIVTGNMSYGNVQALNTTMRHWSMDQSTLSASFSAGSYRSSDGHIDQTLSRDGTTIGHIARSNLPTSVHVAEMASKQLSDQYTNALSLAQGKTIASQQSEFAAYKTAFEKGFSTSQGVSFSDSAGHSLSGVQQDSASLSAQYAEKFAKDNNISTADSTTILAGVSAGLTGEVIKKILGIRADANTQTMANFNDTITKARDYVEQNQLHTTLSYAVHEARDQRYSATDDQVRRFNESIASSFDKSDQFRREASQSLSRAQSLQHQLSYLRAHSSTINRDASQEVLEYVASQPRGGRGPMGMNEALRLAAQEPSMFDAYAQQWVKEKGIKSTLSGLSSADGLASSYDKGAMRSSVGQSYDDFTRDVHASNTKDITVSDHGVRAHADASTTNIEGEINSMKSKILSMKEALDQVHSTESGRSTISRSAEKAWKNIIGNNGKQAQ